MQGKGSWNEVEHVTFDPFRVFDDDRECCMHIPYPIPFRHAWVAFCI